MGAKNLKSLNLHLDGSNYSVLLELKHPGKAFESSGHRQLILSLTRVTSFFDEGLDSCNYFSKKKDKTDMLQAAKVSYERKPTGE